MFLTQLIVFLVLFVVAAMIAAVQLLVSFRAYRREQRGAQLRAR
jgi:archaellin